MEKVEFRYLSQEDILSLNVPYMDVIEAVRDAMAAHGKGLTQLPPKIHVNSRPASFLNAMPAYMYDNREISGMKWVSGYPENRTKGLRSTFILPLQTVGESFNGTVHSLKVEFSAPQAK